MTPAPPPFFDLYYFKRYYNLLSYAITRHFIIIETKEKQK